MSAQVFQAAQLFQHPPPGFELPLLIVGGERRALREGPQGIIGSAYLFGCLGNCAGLIAASSKKACQRNVLIEIGPVHAASAARKLEPGTLAWRCLQESWEPGQRYAERSSVGQLDPHGAVIEPKRLSGNAHAMPFQSPRGAARRFLPIVEASGR